MARCTKIRANFFFSSRRRHTRLVSDWSSDVCSSDLRRDAGGAGDGPLIRRSCRRDAAPARPAGRCRSEEHTSELQSLTNLVCRLLLEKKNKKPRRKHIPFALETNDQATQPTRQLAHT